MLFAIVSRGKKLEPACFRTASTITDTTSIWERKAHIFRSPITAISLLILQMAILFR